MTDVSEVLRHAIKTEYGYVRGVIGLFFLFLILGLLLLIDRKDSKKNDWDGLGIAMILVYARMGVMTVTGFLAGIVHPIWIMIKYREEFRAISSTLLRVGTYLLTLLPILLFLVYVAYEYFGNAISNYFYHKEYRTGKGAYVREPSEYKTPAQFREELLSRGLLFQKKDDELLSRLNTRCHGSKTGNLSKYYYTEGSMMPLVKNVFYDGVDYNEILSADSEKKYPAYVYNAILTLPDEGEKLQYEPFARYHAHTQIGDPNPFFEDYYVECKILYVDGKLCAIIGVDESYNISRYYEKCEKSYEKPFYVVLSETENITTYVDGKYCPYGAIENISGFEMLPNTREFHTGAPFRPINYPVRVVERLDAEAINAVAREFQEGCLKNSIKYHFQRKNYKTPREVIAMLDDRNLTENNVGWGMMERLNQRFEPLRDKKNEGYFYTWSLLMPLWEERFEDTYEQDKFFKHKDKPKSAVFVYNAILTMPEKGERLQYAPCARYGIQRSTALENIPEEELSEKFPYFTDFYVECKILCVGEEVYAIIGVGECKDLIEYGGRSGKSRAWYVILSEKEEITTFVDEKYQEGGAIEIVEDGFLMHAAGEKGFPAYPIRKVARVDADVINEVARELQEGILKDAIEEHFR